MKCSALNVDFNGVRFDPLGSRRPPYDRIKFGYPLVTTHTWVLPCILSTAIVGFPVRSFVLCRFTPMKFSIK